MSRPPGEPQDEAIKIPDVLPVLPLKDIVVFPYIILPLSVGRDKSVLAVDRALSESRVIMLVAQRDAANDNPGEADLFEVGTAAVIMRMLKLPDGRIRILVQGLARARVQHISQMEPYLQAKIERIDEPHPEARSLEIEALVRSVKESMDRAVSARQGDLRRGDGDRREPGGSGAARRSRGEQPGAQAHRGAGGAGDDRSGRAPEAGQRSAGARDPGAQPAAGDLLAGARRDRSQPARVLPPPAAQGDPGGARRGRGARRGDRRTIASRPTRSCSPRRRARSWSARSAVSSACTPRSPSTRSSAPTSTGWSSLPWSKRLGGQPRPRSAPRSVLDEDHYDLEKIKERILEYLAVRKLQGRDEGPDPLLRRSSGRRQDLARQARSPARSAASSSASRSAACATRPRSAAIAAPTSARCPAASSRASSRPARTTRSSCSTRSTSSAPTSAAIPRRRCSKCSIRSRTTRFRDHYLDVAFDLSKVMFIATANMLETIPPAAPRPHGGDPARRLHARRRSCCIARSYLIPKQTARERAHRRADRVHRRRRSAT